VSAAPTLQRDALRESRSLIMAASLGTGVVGLVPLPLVNDLGIGALRALLLQRLADRRGVALSAHAALIAAGELAPSPERLAVTAVLSLGLRLAMRRLGRALLLLLRLDDAGQTFLLGTCFDHYCLSHHPGGPVDARRAAAIHAAVDVAVTRARIQLASALVTRAWTELSRAGRAVPRTFWAACTALLQGEQERAQHQTQQQAEPVTEEARGFLDGISAAAGRELDAAGDQTLSALCQAFDDAWIDSNPPPPAQPPEELVDESSGP
jgi:hypothetical protein